MTEYFLADRIAVYVLCPIVIFNNIIALFAILWSRKLRMNTMYTFIGFLAFHDLFTGVYLIAKLTVLPHVLNDIVLKLPGNTTCGVSDIEQISSPLKNLDAISTILDNFFMSPIAFLVLVINLYYYVCFPFKYKKYVNRKLALKVVIACWSVQISWGIIFFALDFPKLEGPSDLVIANIFKKYYKHSNNSIETAAFLMKNDYCVFSIMKAIMMSKPLLNLIAYSEYFVLFTAMCGYCFVKIWNEIDKQREIRKHLGLHARSKFSCFAFNRRVKYVNAILMLFISSWAGLCAQLFRFLVDYFLEFGPYGGQFPLSKRNIYVYIMNILLFFNAVDNTIVFCWKVEEFRAELKKFVTNLLSTMTSKCNGVLSLGVSTSH